MSEPPPSRRAPPPASAPKAAASKAVPGKADLPMVELPRIDVAVSRLSPRWRRLLPGAGNLARRAARAALAGAAARDGRGPVLAGELSLVLADDRLVHHLNREYRHVDKPTNVLSFPGGGASAGGGEEAADRAPQMLGDVVLAAETVAREAADQGKTIGDHFGHLVVHGVLHLLGYDHVARGEAAAMESLEVEILAGLGIADPYRAGRAGTVRRAAQGKPARAASRHEGARAVKGGAAATAGSGKVASGKATSGRKPRRRPAQGRGALGG